MSINKNPTDRQENDTLRLRSVLLSTQIMPKDKNRILEDSFAIPMTRTMEEKAQSCAI